MLRRLILVSAASAAFGGVVGGLVASASQSEASPRAIAAAVMHVQDAQADRALTKLAAAVSSGTQTTNTNLTALGAAAGAITTAINAQGHDQGTDDQALLELLDGICVNTQGSSPKEPLDCTMPVLTPR